jgi:hypothetical protein
MGSTSVPLRSSPEARLAALPTGRRAVIMSNGYVPRRIRSSRVSLLLGVANASTPLLATVASLGDGSVEAVLTNTYADAGSAHGKTT